MSALKRIGSKLKNYACLKSMELKPGKLSSEVIREIIVIIILLCLSIALSIPEYLKDKEMAAVQKEMLERNQNSQDLSN